MHACKSVTVDSMKNEWKQALEKFVNHYIWQNLAAAIPTNIGILQKLELRVIEMKDRRKKSESITRDHASYQNQKHIVVRGFSALQLENMLKSSSKSVAKEIMSCLFLESAGILSEIIKWLASSSIKKPIRQQQNVMRHGSLTVEEFEKNKKAKKYPLYSLIDKYPRSTSFVIKSLQSKSRYKLYRPKTCQDDNSGSLLE